MADPQQTRKVLSINCPEEANAQTENRFMKIRNLQNNTSQIHIH